MTSDEVIAASNGRAQRTPAVQLTTNPPPSLRMLHEADGFSFSASFYFDRRGLREIVLTLAAPERNAEKLSSALAARYGKPAQIGYEGPRRITTWRSGNDSVSLAQAGDAAWLTYTRSEEPSASR